MEKKFGLIGRTLAHSFSKSYFTEKFLKEDIKDCVYNLYEIKDINEFPDLIRNNPDIRGLNVTIPYKEDVKPFLHILDASAEKVGAVNVIKVKDDGILEGYNSDYYGFKMSLEKWLAGGLKSYMKALILGTGGSSRAVKATLDDLNIEYLMVSRTSSSSTIDYQTMQENPDMLHEFRLIINTTPVGMYPHVNEAPALDYSNISRHHFLYDLVYNPEETRFLLLGKQKGSKIKNGLEMLHLQAEKSWEIWNS